MKEFFSQVTWVDYLAVIAVLRGFWVGYKSGFFPELLRIVTYIVTAIVSFRFHGPLAEFFTLKTVLNTATAEVFALVVLIVGTFGFSTLLVKLLLKLLKIGDGGLFYRLLGMVFGAARWLLLLGLIFMLIDGSPFTTLKTDIHERSLVGPKLSLAAPAIFDFLASLSPQLGLPQKEV